jgi:hypothetical protein
MTPLERAARALKEVAIQPCPDGNPDCPGELFCPKNEAAAVRAVIAAIREPDRPMIEAGGEQVLDTEVGAGQYASIADGRGSKLTADQQATNAWTAMIDAILAGGD